jgi:toxin ParE1/3/4
MREPVLRPAARADLLAIHDYIAAHSPPRALPFIRDIRTRCDALIAHPELGRAQEDLMAGLRILPMTRVVAAYVTLATRIGIIRIFYAGRDWETVLRAGPDD